MYKGGGMHKGGSVYTGGGMYKGGGMHTLIAEARSCTETSSGVYPARRASCPPRRYSSEVYRD